MVMGYTTRESLERELEAAKDGLKYCGPLGRRDQEAYVAACANALRRWDAAAKANEGKA